VEDLTDYFDSLAASIASSVSPRRWIPFHLTTPTITTEGARKKSPTMALDDKEAM
jgi:hypothetical protein